MGLLASFSFMFGFGSVPLFLIENKLTAPHQTETVSLPN